MAFVQLKALHSVFLSEVRIGKALELDSEMAF